MKVLNGTPVTAPLTPGMDGNNDWATHSAKYGDGGLELVDTIKDMNLITPPRRNDKLVIVRKSDNGLPKAYAYVKGSWTEFVIPPAMTIIDEDGKGYIAGSLRFLNSDITPSRVDPRYFTIHPHLTFRNSKSKPKKSASVKIVPPLLLEDDPDFDDGIKLVIDNTILDDFPKYGSDGYLAYSGAPIVVKQYDKDSDVSDYLLFSGGSFVNGRSISVDKADKSATIKAGTDAYYFGFQAYIKGVAKEDGQVTVSLVDSSNPNAAIPDLNGNPTAETFKVSKGDPIGRLYLETLLIAKTDTTIRVKLQTTCGDVVLGGLTSGLTGMVIAGMSSISAVNPVLQQWSIDTGIKPNLMVFDFNGAFISTPSMDILDAQGLKGVKTHPKGTLVNTINNLFIWSQDRFVTKNEQGALFIDDTKFFNVGIVIDSERTRAMRGKRFYAAVNSRPVSSDFGMSVIQWSGSPDNIPMPIGSSITSEGELKMPMKWAHYTKHQVIKQKSDISPDHTSIEFGVSDDAENVAIVVYPLDNKVLSGFGMESIYFTARNDDPKQLLDIDHDNFNGWPTADFDRILPKENVAIKEVKKGSSVALTVDIPETSFLDVKAIELNSDGSRNNVNNISYKYDPKHNVLTVNLGKTGDFTVAIRVYS